MAEAILFNVAKALLKNLGSRALDEIASAWGFKTHLDKLKNTMNIIKDVMLDAEERQVQSHAVRGWFDRLKTAVYAADDLFDELATMALQREVSRDDNLSEKVLDFFSPSNRIAFAFNISKKIKKIREELDDIVKDSSEFAFILRPHEELRLSRQVRDQTHSFVDVEGVIGREDDREAIINILIASQVAQKQLAIIPIVGIGGLGKTTLAQLLYNDERVQKHFELKLWVCVSEVFDIKEIIKKILVSVTNKETQNLEMDQLQGQLRNAIEGKKYLLVLDDVWNENPEEWFNLSAILKVGGDESKILLTARSMKVANIMGTVPTYELKGLSEEKSWVLFEKMAFVPGESEKKPHLVKMGKEIVNKCAAVPLALRALGTLLRESNELQWNSIAGTSIGELHDKQNNMMAILKLSYHHLSPPLKNCFAYCALFPKDYRFEKETLIDLWMAHDFVVPATETLSSNDLGNEYLMFLLQRCFFQDIETDEWGNISSFKMHDLMHDLAIEVAGIESKVAKFKDRNFSDRIRHLSFDYYMNDLWKIPSCMLKSNQLRTFLLPVQRGDESNFSKASNGQLISNFRCVRVLDLHHLGIKTLSKSIGKLIHLRYLNVSSNPIKELPHSITKLQNLRTLKLSNCKILRALPIHTSRLANLRNLDIYGCWELTHMPPGLGELTSLHNLPYFRVHHKLPIRFTGNLASAQLRDLKTLNNLRGSLNIHLSGYLNDPVSKANDANLRGKCGLTTLNLNFGKDHFGFSDSNHYEAILEGLKPHQNLKKLIIKSYLGAKLPSWAMSNSLCMTLPNLVDISLSWWPTCSQVPCFSQLPFLKRLSLDSLKSVEYMERSLHGIQFSQPPTQTFFPSLQKLELSYMNNLKGWWEETETEANDCSSQRCPQPRSFSHLRELVIRDCKNLATFPLCPNVEILSLRKVSKHLTVLKKPTSSAVGGDVGSSLKTLEVDEVSHLINSSEECLGHITFLEIMDPNLLNTSRLEGVFKHLSSLTSLRFTNCESLTSIYEGLEHLTSLANLRVDNCRELDLALDEVLDDGMPWKALKGMTSLSFKNIPKLVHLPSGLQHLTKLRQLAFLGNDNLVALPEWISCFSSLKYMKLDSCVKLTCLPEEFAKLTSLDVLDINGCPGLTLRCQDPTGGDWHKIQHVPRVTVKEGY